MKKEIMLKELNLFLIYSGDSPPISVSIQNFERPNKVTESSALS